MNTELQRFVRQALSEGVSRQKIAAALKSAGWQEDEVKLAMSSYADSDLPVPVPRRKPYLSAREAFLHLLMFLTLYISAFSVGTIIFQFINTWLPDPLQYDYAREGIRSALRSGTSALIIAFPVFLLTSYILAKARRKDPDTRGSKWLTYITLFIAAGIIIGDLIGLVYNLLGGELTMRFALKVLTVGVISGTIFGYYLWDLRKDEK